MNWRSGVFCGAFALITNLVALPAMAGEFELGGFEGSFNSQISLGGSWRMLGSFFAVAVMGSRVGAAILCGGSRLL